MCRGSRARAKETRADGVVVDGEEAVGVGEVEEVDVAVEVVEGVGEEARAAGEDGARAPAGNQRPPASGSTDPRATSGEAVWGMWISSRPGRKEESRQRRDRNQNEAWTILSLL